MNLRLLSPKRIRGLALLALGVMAGGIFAGPIAVLVIAGVGVGIHWRKKATKHQKQKQALTSDLGEVIDLFRLGCSAGLTVWLSLQEVARYVEGPLGNCLKDAAFRVQSGAGLAETLEWLSRQHGGQLRLLTRPLIEAERYGVPVVPSLDQASMEAKRLRRKLAESAIRSLPLKLMFPLVLCILPAFGLLSVVPQIISTLDLLQTPNSQQN